MRTTIIRTCTNGDKDEYMPTLEQCNTKLQLIIEICTRRAYFLMSTQTLLVIYNVVSLQLYTYIRRYKTIIPFEGNRETMYTQYIRRFSTCHEIYAKISTKESCSQITIFKKKKKKNIVLLSLNNFLTHLKVFFRFHIYSIFCGDYFSLKYSN